MSYTLYSVSSLLFYLLTEMILGRCHCSSSLLIDFALLR